MKVNRLSTLIVLGLALTTLVGSGCKKTPKYPTDIPPASRSGNSTKPSTVSDIGTGRSLPDGGGSSTANPITDTDIKNGAPLANLPLDKYTQDREKLAEYTVHFAFDSAAIRESDLTKVESVANFLKSNPATAVLIEGHTDKRGTEEYNRSLGERRALSAREKLLGLGISSERIATISFGEDKPVDPAENEAAFAKNRRGEFVLLTVPAN